MIRNLDQTRHTWKHSLFAALGLMAWAGMHNTTAAAEEETYTWSAELVALDEANSTITVKSRVFNHAGIESLPELSAGDRVMLTWSGHFTASGIRTITPGTESDFDRFTMPVEFVASERDGRYVQFRVPIPSQDVTNIAALTPGRWVTGTSPHRPAGWDEAVTAIRAFTDVT